MSEKKKHRTSWSWLSVMGITLLILLLFVGYAYVWEENVTSTRGMALHRSGELTSDRSLWIEEGGWFVPEQFEDFFYLKISVPSLLPEEKTRFIELNIVTNTLVIRAGKTRTIT